MKHLVQLNFSQAWLHCNLSADHEPLQSPQPSLKPYAPRDTQIFLERIEKQLPRGRGLITNTLFLSGPDFVIK